MKSSEKLCLACRQPLTSPWQKKFCSNQCQKDFEHAKFIERWLASSGKGLITKNISRHIKKYLIETHGEKCSRCQWALIHPITKRVPLEVEHIDGNAENNSPDNVALLCPNCHSLTVHFRNLNNGQGRTWRRKINQ